MNTETFPIKIKYRFGWGIVVALLFTFVFGLVTVMVDSIRNLSQGWLISLGLLACVSGWFFGGIKQKAGRFFLLGILIGLILLIFAQSESYKNFFQAFSVTLQFQLNIRNPGANLTNIKVLLFYLYQAVSNLSGYLREIFHWMSRLLFQSGGYNALASKLLWGSSLWAALYSMAWLLRRKTHAFLASLPSLILLVAVIGSTHRNTPGLVVALSALLPLMVLFEYLHHETRWEEQKIDYSEEMRFDIISTTIPLVALIMIFASLIPQISLEPLRTIFDQKSSFDAEQRINLPDSLGLDQAPGEDFQGFAQTGMPRSHLIGSGSELSDVKIMEIDTGETYLPPSIDPLNILPDYYWFGRSYDIYLGTKWMTSEIRQETISANEKISTSERSSYYPVAHTVRKFNSAPSTLYFTGILETVDQPITVAWLEITGEFLSAQSNAREYQVKSLIPFFTEAQLNLTDSVTPQPILDTYLQLPPELPPRVTSLAESLTNPGSTTFEKAQRIENYLRQFEYTLALPNPPNDRDLVDYFLFDLQKGYCDYFASAMVVLARASGIPARLAVGYATGNYDYQRQVFVVTEANAHAWPEIHIEPYGWIPFEPTASFSQRNWSADFNLQPPESIFPPNQVVEIEENSAWRNYITLGLSILIPGLVGLLWILIVRRRRRLTSPLVGLELIYQKTRNHLIKLFFKPQIEQTPSEFYQAYAQYLHRLDKPKWTEKLTQQIVKSLFNITNLYEIGVYSPKIIPFEQTRQAWKSLQGLQTRAWLLRASLFLKGS
jgi:transglutaminase-like putative cysteine protease